MAKRTSHLTKLDQSDGERKRREKEREKRENKKEEKEASLSL